MGSRCIPTVASLVCLLPCLVAGCTKPTAENPAGASSKPPNISSLASVDSAEVSYANECIVIQGIVSPEHQGGWPSEGSDYQVHCFCLAAWRQPGEPVIERDLTVLRPVHRDSRYFDDFPAYSIHRMSVLLSTDGTRAVFDRLLPLNETDKELLAFGAELRKPVVISTKTFGDVVLNRETGWFEVKATWNGRLVSVDIHRDDTKSIKVALATAESLWADQSRWSREASACVIKELLPIKNANWLGEGEKAVSESEFLKRIKLKSISFHDDGSFSFWYSDGDLFFGHLIEVGGNLKDGVRYASFHG